MTTSQQTPLFSDILRPFWYPVKQTAKQNYVQITAAGGSQLGSITFKPDSFFFAYAVTCYTNYDNVAPPIATANSNAILGRPDVPNNFTVQLQRGDNNNYSSLPMPQPHFASSGNLAGKDWPLPVVYGPRSNLQFTFQDTTGLFLLTATSGGTPVPLKIQMFFVGYHIPIGPDGPNSPWSRFCRIYPNLAKIYGAAAPL